MARGESAPIPGRLGVAQPHRAQPRLKPTHHGAGSLRADAKAAAPKLHGALKQSMASSFSRARPKDLEPLRESALLLSGGSVKAEIRAESG